VPSNAASGGPAAAVHPARRAAVAAQFHQPLTDSWTGARPALRRGRGPLGQQRVDVGGPAVPPPGTGPAHGQRGPATSAAPRAWSASAGRPAIALR
jgi:hypothetical protein